MHSLVCCSGVSKATTAHPCAVPWHQPLAAPSSGGATCYLLPARAHHAARHAGAVVPLWPPALGGEPQVPSAHQGGASIATIIGIPRPLLGGAVEHLGAQAALPCAESTQKSRLTTFLRFPQQLYRIVHRNANAAIEDIGHTKWINIRSGS